MSTEPMQQEGYDFMAAAWQSFEPLMHTYEH